MRERLQNIPMEQVSISANTEAELRFGAACRPDAHGLRTAVEEFILRVDVLPWDSVAAQSYAVLRAHHNAKGISLGAMDMLIAAHALATHSILVSNDQAFGMVDHRQVEDWIS